MVPEAVSVAFARACRKVGIADFRFHDLRHTAASWMRMKGADIHTVGQLLGHKDLRMAARYQHSFYLIWNALNSAMFQLLRPGPTTEFLAEVPHWSGPGFANDEVLNHWNRVPG